ncbi:MAG: A/G-specific adenine glycosylase [Spirochaetales bacterium]|nr:A/G-specific adenine glycosylase [Spirochaetales bacterium]
MKKGTHTDKKQTAWIHTVKKLTAWFHTEKQAYPWRRERTPYSVWISEIMLQQTTVATVIPRYHQWMEKFPSLEALAKSNEQEVLREWEGLGYYSRAKNILKTAVILNEKTGFPSTPGELTALPGIGPYTAAAISSIAFGRPHPVMDANVKRVFCRFLHFKTLNSEQEREITRTLNTWIRMTEPGPFNEAVMELGQRICVKKNPSCSFCPLGDGCLAYKRGDQNSIPEVKSKKYRAHESSVFLLTDSRKLLIKQSRGNLLKGLWLLPKVPHTDDKGREVFIKKHLAREFSLVGEFKPLIHAYTINRERLYPFHYKVIKKIHLPAEEYRWVEKKSLSRYPFPSVYRKIIQSW